MRPVDLPLLLGDAGRLRALGWHFSARGVDDALADSLGGGASPHWNHWNRLIVYNIGACPHFFNRKSEGKIPPLQETAAP